MATAVTSLAPSLAMPPDSYWRPTIKPEIFCKNNNGILRWAQSSMKCAPLSALSENKIPLLPMIPIGIPQRWAKPVTKVVPYNALNSSNSEPSTNRAITSRISYCFFKSVGTKPSSSAESKSGSRGSRITTLSGFRIFKLATIERAICNAWASSIA